METKVWVRIDTETLVYGGEWNDVVSTIRAKLFGRMIDLAKDRIKYYMSDLFHDAIWLRDELIAPMGFEWIARESGTHIGDVCRHINDKDWPESVRYRFVIRLDDNGRWVLDTYHAVMERPHADLSTEECDSATTPAGCIYHPADIATRCTGHYDGGGSLQHDGDTCPIHENTPNVPDTVQEIINLLEPNIPTLRNDLNMEPVAPTRKEMKMEDIIRDLREKMQEAESSKEQLEEYQSNISDGIDELETYISDLDDLISSLDSLPEVSIYVDLDTVSFDS